METPPPVEAPELLGPEFVKGPSLHVIRVGNQWVDNKFVEVDEEWENANYTIEDGILFVVGTAVQPVDNREILIRAIYPPGQWKRAYVDWSMF